MQKQHIIVYREPGAFAGWPANYGMWAWGNEIVVGFTHCFHQPAAGFHARDTSKPAYPFQSRSLDGGLSWQTGPVPAPSPGGRGFSADEHMLPHLQVGQAIKQGLGPLPAPCPDEINFTQPNFALMCARTGLGGGARAWFYYTDDRAHTWQGPFAIPDFGQPGIEARTDVIIEGEQDATFFFSAARENGAEGAGVLMARTANGAKDFNFVSWVTTGEDHYSIMPSSLRLNSTTLLSAVRCRQTTGEFPSAPTWVDLFESVDNGATWRPLSRPVPDAGPGGNPPAMLKLQDGRIVLVYGYRAAPYGIRARLSADGGKTWGEVIHLREDGGCSDLGYPRTIQRPDGLLVTCYYFNDHPETERYIAATLWQV